MNFIHFLCQKSLIHLYITICITLIAHFLLNVHKYRLINMDRILASQDGKTEIWTYMGKPMKWRVLLGEKSVR